MDRTEELEEKTIEELDYLDFMFDLRIEDPNS